MVMFRGAYGSLKHCLNPHSIFGLLLLKVNLKHLPGLAGFANLVKLVSARGVEGDYWMKLVLWIERHQDTEVQGAIRYLFQEKLYNGYLQGNVALHTGHWLHISFSY